MDRRHFLKTASLVATGGLVPEFLVRAAAGPLPPGDRLLVVVEMTGGNDGLNTVIPFADALYRKARPRIAIPKDKVLRIDGQVGLHPGLLGLKRLLERNELAVVLGVGYPNPSRSHFDSMDVWHSAEARPRGAARTGWISRGLSNLKRPARGFQALHVGPTRLPLALQGPAAGIVSLDDPQSFSLRFSGDDRRKGKRRKLLESLNSTGSAAADDLTSFIRGRQSQVLRGTDALHKALAQGGQPRPATLSPPPPAAPVSPLAGQLGLIARLIREGIGARVYYASIDGFDTHARQPDEHARLLTEVGSAIETFFGQLRPSGDGKRVLLMTFSEFGRRVRENGSGGTDHGAASHLFVAGPAVKAGLVGKYPRLDDLDSGDLRHGIDFRRVYATLLDGWLGCDSKVVLGGSFEHVPLLARKSTPRP
jgi:uncharacterized protein (DUF1501 family)